MHHAPQQVPAIITAVAPYINQHGYLAVLILVMLEDFGIPVPGETVLTAAAFFAGVEGHLNIFLVGIVAFFGAVIGDNIGFAIGHYGGHPLIERFGKYVFLTPPRVAKAEAFFNRNGGKVVIVARFIEGLRQVNGLIAGLSEMKWPKFLVFNAIGAALWVGLWTTVGYLGGSHIQTFLRYQLYVTITAVVGVIAYVMYRAIKHRREQKLS